MKTRFDIAVLMVIAIAIPSSLAAQVKTRIAWTSFASNMAGTWVAQEEGLFRKNGVEAELAHIPSTSRAIQTMIAGEIAFTYMDGRNSVQAGLKGIDVVILAGVANRLVFSFMSRPEIKNFAQLRGKRSVLRAWGLRRTASPSGQCQKWASGRKSTNYSAGRCTQYLDRDHGRSDRRWRFVATDKLSRA